MNPQQQAVLVILVAAAACLLILIFLAKRKANRLEREEEARKKNENDLKKSIAEKTSVTPITSRESAAVFVPDPAEEEVTGDPKEIKPFYTAAEAADYLDISVSNLYRWRDEGEFPKGQKRSRDGKSRKQLHFTRVQLEKWKAENADDLEKQW